MTLHDLSLEEAQRRLDEGEIIVHPTEAVYGFGGFLDAVPLDHLRTMKNRSSAGFVVLIPSAESVGDLLDAPGHALAESFWPGPLTLVLDDPRDRFPPRAKAPDGSVAVRVPGHPSTLRLLRRTGRPITSTSANRPGARPALTADRARKEALALGAELFALDAGPLPGGPPSTLVRLGADCPKVIRRGPLDMLQLSEVVGLPPFVPSGGGGARMEPVGG